MKLDCGTRVLDLSRPRVMGILNVTPDSFADGGRYTAVDAALARAREMLAEGADIIDVGGESTRPGAAPVTADEEVARVLPVIEAIASELDVVISVDTTKPAIMREAVRAGACLINDVNALRSPGALAAAAETGAAVCLMHMQGEPRTMQTDPHYADVVEEVRRFLHERVQAAMQAGIAPARILVDPGFGFGKTLAHNIALLAHLDRLADSGVPLLAGVSRKSMIGSLLDGRPVEERLFGSLAAAVVAVMKGAAILRVHDVAPTLDALRVLAPVLEQEKKG